MSTDLVEQSPSGELNPLQLIDTAVANGVDAEKLKQLMDLQREWQADRAREAFNQAMSEAQAEIPTVVADAYNTHTKSKYAKIEKIDQVIKPVYTNHGFALSFGTILTDNEKLHRIYCDCRHKEGHVERYEGDFPADLTGSQGTTNKTPIQAMGSTISYGRRYLTLMIFNVAVAGEDNDGVQAVQCISEDQIATLNRIMERIHPDDEPLEKLLKWAGIDSLDKLPLDYFLRAKESLQKQAARYEQSDESN